MGIRENLNDNPRFVTGATVAMLTFAIGYIAFQVLWEPSRAPIVRLNAYYTSDDGQTIFADEANRLVPYERDGRTVVRAAVFSCDGGKTKFVGYLERLSQESLTQLRQLQQTPEAQQGSLFADGIASQGLEYKKPHPASTAHPPTDPDTNPNTSPWVSAQSPEALRTTLQTRCPDGSTTNLQQVFP